MWRVQLQIVPAVARYELSGVVLNLVRCVCSAVSSAELCIGCAYVLVSEVLNRIYTYNIIRISIYVYVLCMYTIWYDIVMYIISFGMYAFLCTYVICMIFKNMVLPNLVPNIHT